MPDDTQHTKNQQGQADLVQHHQAIGNAFQAVSYTHLVCEHA